MGQSLSCRGWDFGRRPIANPIANPIWMLERASLRMSTTAKLRLDRRPGVIFVV